MFELPGFDPRTMTDEQLVTKSGDLQAKIAWAAGGLDNGAVGVMQRMLEVIANERRERGRKAQFKAMSEADPIANETDPVLREQNRKAAAEKAGKDEVPGAPRPRISARRTVPVPTATPVAPAPDTPIREQPPETKP